MFGCREHHYDLRSPAYYEGALRPINPTACEPHLAAAEIRHAHPRLHSDRRTRTPSRPNAATRHFPLFLIFHGTRDILFADTRKLIARLDQEGIAVDFFEFPIWALFPMSEAQAAVAKLAGLINGK
jgi:acetyl esterase/lipase